MVEKPDPFDVAALEKSVNDSAVRVSAIWASFLIFALYLVIAAGTVTHRQLFLDDPVKLPVLNIDLPLWGFFFLAPILFVIFHAYVLLQVLLLGRTAAAYNAAIERAGLSAEETASLRQRLANTLFAQIFAGSPREREGWLGGLLKAMAWITLALAPILVLLVFQFAFLPYHSHIATWTHRLLILTELAEVFLLWPLVLDARRDLEWPWIRLQPGWPAAAATGLPASQHAGRLDRRRLGRLLLPVVAGLLFVLVSLSLATFPGEPHVNLLTGKPLRSVQCTGWLSEHPNQFQELVEPRTWRTFDRLDLTRADVVDDERLPRIEKATSERKLHPSKGERTRTFRDRDLNCGVFDLADLRHVDLTNARMFGASLRQAALQGASLDGANLEDASFNAALLQGASLAGARLWEASLDSARLQGASLESAQLQGAFLRLANLQGAVLKNAELQGALLRGAGLEGASLDGAHLQGVILDDARLQGASLQGARLQGASLRAARLAGAELGGAWLQGATFDSADLRAASLFSVSLEGASLKHARLEGASLFSSALQAASLERASLQGASFDFVQMQGADLGNSKLAHAVFSWVQAWRAGYPRCENSYAVQVQFDIIGRFKRRARPATSQGSEELIELKTDATPQQIEEFIRYAIEEIPEGAGRGRPRDAARARLHARLVAPLADAQDYQQAWLKCRQEQRPSADFDKGHAAFLADLFCHAWDERRVIGRGLYRNWLVPDAVSREFRASLARGMLGLDGRDCPAARELDDATRERLRAILSGSAAGAEFLEPLPAFGRQE